MANDDRSSKAPATQAARAQRPKISAGISREILIESGHRCAVCGESCSLEKAHIIPWCETREHRKENLICLCATCHQRADQEKWGPKILHEYKRKPWVLRKGTDLAIPQPARRVQLTLSVEFTTFDVRLERLLVHALAGLLEISPEAVKICSVEKGSVRLVVELPMDAAERLIQAGESGVMLLEDYVDSLGEIRVSGAPENSEEMVETLGSAEQLADLKAQARCQYAKALRISGQLRKAEEAFTEARQLLENGTGDPTIRADLLREMAQLRIVQRRFNEAILMADEAAHIYSDTGKDLSASRSMVTKAIAQHSAGEPDAATLTLNQAIPIIDAERNPGDLLAACHNLIGCYLDLEQPEQALSLYSKMRDLYRDFPGDPLITLRAGWQEGQILRDLGHLQSAKETLLQARRGFVEHQQINEAAMVSLDLMTVYLKLNDMESVRQAVAEMSPIFRSLGLDREILASLASLPQRVPSVKNDQNLQALELVYQLGAKLKRIISQR
jgi:tetratricopeptide (TPR) repeat protein